METVEVTTMTSRGQVVIPQAVREALELGAGTKFVVAGEGDTVILKRIGGPSVEELKALLSRSRRLAREKGLKKADLKEAIDRERKER